MFENILEILTVTKRYQKTLQKLLCKTPVLGDKKSSDSVGWQKGYVRLFWEVESKVGIKEDLEA